MNEVTRILSGIEAGDPHAAAQLLPLVYDELRKLAAQKLAQEQPGQTLQATALVHEAYLRLVGRDQDQHWDSRGHFFAAAAEAMRQRLSLGLESRDHLPRIHAWLDDFERYFAMDGLLLLGDEDQSHAALADLFQQLVRANHRAGPLADRIIDGGDELGSRCF
jgi:hypothetical protein